MKILVCISKVPDTTAKISLTDGDTKFNEAGVQFIINPYDEFALTKAMILKESLGGTITIITVGNASVEPVMRKALAIGADNAVRINMAATDSYSTASEIANYLKDKSFDLIIAGKESIDYNGGMVPGMIAGLNNANFINNCINLEIDGTKATAIREIDGGKETIESSTPLVIGAQKGLVEESDLRIPNMRGIMMARKKQLEVIPAIDASNQTDSIEFEKPKPKGEVTLVSSENLDELINLLHNEAKVI